MIQFITRESIQAIAIRQQPTPVPEPIGDIADRYRCMVCSLFRPLKMLLHYSCGRTIWAECCLSVIATGTCALCRGDLWGQPLDSATLRLLFVRPTPNDQVNMDFIRYKCRACNAEMDYHDALQHPAVCNLQFDERHPNIIRRSWQDDLLYEEPVLRHEVVSNPYMVFNPSIRNADPALLIMRLNGNRIAARQYRRSTAISHLRSGIARLAELETLDGFEIYTFQHRRLTDTETLRNVALGPGVTHLAAFTTDRATSMQDRTVNLFFRNVSKPTVPLPESMNNNGNNISNRARRLMEHRCQRTIQREAEEAEHQDPFESDEEEPPPLHDHAGRPFRLG